jgi:Secretion system C-terminal sorting domain/HmuY protein
MRFFNYALLFALSIGATSVVAQTIKSITTGAGYKKQSFVKLNTGTETIVDDTSWDIAFTVYGQQDAGIHINESAGSSMGQALPGVSIFDALSTDFAATPDPTVLTDFQLLNDETSWAFGALNSGRVASNPFDYGWGAYVPGNGAVTGSKVFVVKLRNGTFKKLQIQSLTGLTYTFRYADLNGANERTATVNKADHTGKTLAYYSLTTNQSVQAEPTGGFDLLYCRYVTKLYDPSTMTDINYQLTGVLNGRGVEVAKATSVTQTDVDYAKWDDSLSTRIDVIGHDWKSFTGAGWVVATDFAYYVRAANDNVYHMYFIDFEGSATGTAVYEIRNLGIITSVTAGTAAVSTFDVYPNPATTEAQVVCTAPKATEAQLQIIDMSGRVLQQRNVSLQAGFQSLPIDVSAVAAGVYQVVLRSEQGVASQKLVIN